MPISEPSTAIDQTLLGDWDSYNAESKSAGDIVTISRHSDKEYAVYTHSKESDTKGAAKKKRATATPQTDNAAKTNATAKPSRGKKSPQYDTRKNIFPMSFIAHASELDGITLLNLRNAKGDGDSIPEYIFFKLERPTGDELLVTPVSRRIKEKFERAEDLRAFIVKNKDLSVFYDYEEAITLRRRPAK
jgi:hypothetical protein